jgi:hypothetical protein
VVQTTSSCWHNRHIKNAAAIGFNLRHWQQVRFDNELDLKTLLVNALVQHYGWVVTLDEPVIPSPRRIC